MSNQLLTTLLFSVLLLLSACETAEKSNADLILHNGNIYTVDTDQPIATAVAVQDGKIIAIGDDDLVDEYKGETTKVIDLEGQFMMPGFIEGHAHFSGLGTSLMNLNFLRSKNWNEIVQMVGDKAKTAEAGEWITGRGWHQEKWNEVLDRQVLGYPYHDELSAVSQDNPVVLRHASGHSLFANAKAMEIAGINAESPNPAGGEIVRDSRGEAIGVFEETAMAMIMDAYSDYVNSLSEEENLAKWYEGIELAEENALSNGITSFQDAGASFAELGRYKEMAENGELDIRLWAMISSSQDDFADGIRAYPLVGAGDNFFTVRSVKAYMDGALGAFGAWMLRPYADKPEAVGQNVTPIIKIKEVADLTIAQDLQLCTHAIGDRGNRMVLNLYEQAFEENPTKENLRWRIEHAQHIDTTDIPRFQELGVIASMQGVHCTSDAPFVVKRLGESRARYGAYPWRSLIDAGAVVTNGTDAPVEDISPIESYYASVTRRRDNPEMVFFAEQSMTRAEAIHSYTLAPAYAAFEEDIKGSIEVGKVADFVVLSNDLMTCDEEAILETKVVMTIVDGEVKYEQREMIGRR
ncbi:MAG: amidohydrolase [Bacteroidota bacterium]